MATNICQWETNWGAFKSHWEHDGKHFVVSSVDHSDACETMIFAADSDGQITNWLDLFLCEFTRDHADVVERFLSHHKNVVPDPMDLWSWKK